VREGNVREILNRLLKPLLVQCALAAVRSKKQPYFAIKYQKLKKRRGHKKAIIAIARMMLTCIYHIIQTSEAFNPSDYESFNTSAPRKVALTDENAIAFLASQGYDISSLHKIFCVIYTLFWLHGGSFCAAISTRAFTLALQCGVQSFHPADYICTLALLTFGFVVYLNLSFGTSVESAVFPI